MLGVTTMLNFFTTSNGFRSNLPVVSNLTAMNLWDAVCMGFIYTSFLEFVVVNYLARWVQDPEIQKRKRDNAILDVSCSEKSFISFFWYRKCTIVYSSKYIAVVVVQSILS